jgi:hypothetical protein
VHLYFVLHLHSRLVCNVKEHSEPISRPAHESYCLQQVTPSAPVRAQHVTQTIRFLTLYRTECPQTYNYSSASTTGLLKIGTTRKRRVYYASKRVVASSLGVVGMVSRVRSARSMT